jgi:hypothetical protein
MRNQLVILLVLAGCRGPERQPWGAIRSTLEGWKEEDIVRVELRNAPGYKGVSLSTTDRRVIAQCVEAVREATRRTGDYSKGGRGTPLSFHREKGHPRTTGFKLNPVNAGKDFGPAMEPCVRYLMRHGSPK